MAEVAHLDTHVVVWMVMEERYRLSDEAIKLVNVSSLMISPIVILELQYLVDKKKIEGHPLRMVEKLRETIGLEICGDPFDSVVREAMHLSWTRDPFDRLITAQSALTKSQLITRDENIRRHYPHTVWD